MQQPTMPALLGITRASMHTATRVSMHVPAFLSMHTDGSRLRTACEAKGGSECKHADVDWGAYQMNHMALHDDSAAGASLQASDGTQQVCLPQDAAAKAHRPQLHEILEKELTAYKTTVQPLCWRVCILQLQRSNTQ